MLYNVQPHSKKGKKMDEYMLLHAVCDMTADWECEEQECKNCPWNWKILEYNLCILEILKDIGYSTFDPEEKNETPV